MKIGLSYSRCVRDIIDGKVNIDDVLVIITRTDFDPHDDKEWSSIWTGYGGGQATADGGGRTSGNPFSNLEWMDYTAEQEDLFRSVSIELWESGKMHQPRKFGAHPTRRPEIWLEAVLPDSELASRPAVKDAWDKFQMLANLTNTTINKDYQ